MKALSLCILISFFFIIPVIAYASIITSYDSPASISLSGAFGPIADDGNAVFLNPAGLVQSKRVRIYFDYVREAALGPSNATKLAIAVPYGNFVFASGWFRGVGNDEIEDRVSVGVSRLLIEGTVGSFLSTGLTLDYARATIDDLERSLSGSSSGATASLGVMLRPLPVLSFSYSILNIGGMGLSVGDERRWPRSMRWGVAYFWRQRVTLVFEQERRESDIFNRYGFILKTALPLELMSGFSGEKLSAGARWTTDSFIISCAFSSNRGAKLTISACAEYRFGKKEESYSSY